MSDKKVLIIGAGPAGLTAAYELGKAGIPSLVLEKDNVVGGLARTVEFNGFHFDIGGHRFFTKVKPVEDMWHEVLKGDFIKRNRLSRIYYNKKFYFYPIRFTNALFNLGSWNSTLVILSYIKSQLFPQVPELTFEQWVSNRFGQRLYKIFFKTYTEKVWGMSCNEISAEWAAQRIKGLSLFSALRNALINQQTSKQSNVIKTLVDSFYYPRLGPGMMWQAVKKMVLDQGGEVMLGANVEKIYWSDSLRRVNGIEISINGKRVTVNGSDIISSMPIRELIGKLHPAVPQRVLEAASNLRYRDFLTVVLIIDKENLFPDNWIYIHDPNVKLGRIQNFKNWSPDMVPDPSKTCLGLEYFCFEGDGLWSMPDHELIDLGKREIDLLGLVDRRLVENGTVVRMPKAYPVYDSTYQDSLRVIKEFLDRLDNLQLIGRNGMHKYNNQDHSMLTAMLAVKNIMGAKYDLWQVNADKEYLEELSKIDRKEISEYVNLASTQPQTPNEVFSDKT
ncbi:MAG: NAD(P)/FAD-dependent oxidoreductase, partial [Thermodesulfobacteriota bacterium]